MEPADHLAALRRDADAMVTAARAGDLRAPVPSCPGWDLAELLWHTGEVHYFWREIAAGRRQSPDGVERFPRPDDGALVDWFAAGADHLLDVLTASDPSTPVWTWAPQKDIAFIQRRMAQETAVHRWDAEIAATQRPDRIEPSLAHDGVDEFFAFFVSDEERPTHRIDVVTTEVAGRWSVGPDEPEPVATLRSDASTMLLALWRRVPMDGVDVDGDAPAAAAFVAGIELD